MINRLENVLVECLVDTLSTLVCSESSDIITTTKSLIGKYSLFKLSRVQSVDSLKQQLNDHAEWHCLIADSRCSFMDQFYTAVRQLPYWVPVILLTDSLSQEHILNHELIKDDDEKYILHTQPSDQSKHNKCQMKLIYSCPLRSYKKMFELLQMQSIKKKLFGKMVPAGVALDSFRILFDQRPVTVESWSKHVDLTPRKLQRALKGFSFFSPKKIISLYHAYHIAFSTIDEVNNINRGIISAYVMDDTCKRRVMEYVLSRRSQLLHS